MAAKRRATNRKQQDEAYQPWNNLWRRDAAWRISVNGKSDWRRFQSYTEFRAYIEQQINEGKIPPAAQIRASRIQPQPKIIKPSKPKDTRSFWDRWKWLLP